MYILKEDEFGKKPILQYDPQILKKYPQLSSSCSSHISLSHDGDYLMACALILKKSLFYEP